jgi:glutamate-ammonia-ligase adenylyltransferase
LAADPAESLRHLVERAMARLAAAAPALRDAPALQARIAQLAVASDFALDTLLRQPALVATLDDAPAPLAIAAGTSDADASALLRRWRAAESTRLVWRDLHGLDDVDQTLAGSTRIAEQALAAGLAQAEAGVAARHGVVRAGDGSAQSLVVFGLGKLGGGELNFSSDVDLIYAYEESGESDGPRPLAADDWYTRVGQRLATLLGDVTADGFSHRVDLRLRPFGGAGRLALSFSAMEQYYQREGRDWERYAWIKARPVAGDIAAGERLAATLRPFVYRRYLDYNALDGLREMKAMIDAEVGRRELADNLKLGPGGIREVEFLVQALQLIRGGREPALRQRGLLAALAALGEAGHLSPASVQALAAAYRFLRRLENRVQMLGDQQVHALPEAPLAALRIARGLGHADVAALRVVLDAHRAVVSAEFDALLQARRRRGDGNAFAAYWQALPDGGDAGVLANAGFADAEALHARLSEFAGAPAVRGLSPRARQRLDHVLPALLEASARSDAPDAAMLRGLALLQAIARRTSYLALLDEQPAALARLIDVVSRSALLSERLVAHPLLLDELLDARGIGRGPEPEAIAEAFDALQRGVFASAGAAPDVEAALVALNELRQAHAFRIALAALAQSQPALSSALQLAALADAVLRVVLALALADIARVHGRLPGVGFAVIAYGSVGGRELGFDSDLDLVFLHDAQGDEQSDGARPIDAPRWLARLAQKLTGLLGTLTAAGRLYDVDMRLRPDGAKGVLVSSLASFSAYQRARAWTWEQQALVRARALAGDAAVLEAFEALRTEVLLRPRERSALLDDVVAMRRRMRAELDRGNAARFDLKQGEGGLVDLEFLVQAEVLAGAAAQPALAVPRDTPTLLDALRAAGILDAGTHAALREAHALLLARSLDCTLDRRPRLCAEDAAIAAARAAIRAACHARGLAFDAAPSPDG